MIRQILALILTVGLVAACTPTTAAIATDTVDNADATAGKDASSKSDATSGDAMDPNDMGDMDMGTETMPGMDM